MGKEKKLNREKRLLSAIFFIAFSVRIAGFGSLPRGLNQDEAFSGYEAFALATGGADSFGYPLPVYLTVWGSGMSLLQSLMAIPFIKIFGLTGVAIRMPQLVVGLASLWVFYLLLKNLFSDSVALAGLFAMAISPWHIMMCRWALDANLAPGFLIFGLYFLLKGIDDNRYWLACGFCYGLCLYAYAVTWAVIPATLVLSGVYILLSKVEFKWKYVFLSAGILFVFALPLILFLFVNKDIIPEIVTPWFSIPKLLYMRSGEVNPANIFSPRAWKHTLTLVVTGYDGLPWNSIEKYGMFYKIGLPFIAVGFAKLVYDCAKSIKSKVFSKEVMVLLAAASAFVVCLMLGNANINRANCLHIYTLIMLATGLDRILGFFKANKFICMGIILGFALSFAGFVNYYFTRYNIDNGYYFRTGVRQAVEKVNSRDFKNVWVDPSVYYPQVMFYDKTPPEEYRHTVEYTNYPSAFLSVSSFTKYTFGGDADTALYDRFIIHHNDGALFTDAGLNVEIYGEYGIAY